MTEKEDFELRLENWGRWSREGKGAGFSNLMFVLQNLPPKKKGKDEEQETFKSETAKRPYCSEKDALLVQLAWSMLPCTSREDQEAKALIGVVYAYQGYSEERILDRVRLVRYSKSQTPIRIRRKNFDRLLDQAKKMMKNILERLDAREGF